MIPRLGKVYIICLGLSVLILLLNMVGIWHPMMSIGLFTTLMVLTGIPHGALDHLIFVLNEGGERRINWPRFLLYYLATMLVYGLLWWALPAVSLIVFLVISAYHFGQSQYWWLKGDFGIWNKFFQVVWGGLILVIIILLHPGESKGILLELLPGSVAAIEAVFARSYGIIAAAIFLTAVMLFTATMVRTFTFRQMSREIIHLILLFGISQTCDLLTSFAVYFGLWHAPAALYEIGQTLKAREIIQNQRDLIIRALPFSLISFAGIGLLIALSWIEITPFSPVLLFFIAISVLTMPHMVQMEGFYQRQSFSG